MGDVGCQWGGGDLLDGWVLEHGLDVFYMVVLVGIYCLSRCKGDLPGRLSMLMGVYSRVRKLVKYE